MEAPRTVTAHSVFTEPLALVREATVRDGVCLICGSGVLNGEHLRDEPCPLDLIEQRAAEMERVLRELVDAVRILDVMLREPAAEGLMSAEDYRSYLQGAWLGVDEKVEQARAALSAREEAQ